MTSKQISLTYECWKLKYQKPKPTARYNIEAIVYTTLSYKGQAKNNHPSITIWADTKPYRIKSTSGNLSVTELDWLAQELSEWLDIPVTKE